MTCPDRRRPHPLLLGGGASLLAFVVLGAVVWLAHGPVGSDATVHSMLIATRNPTRDPIARLVTFTGSAPFVYPMACLVAAILVAVRRRAVAAAWIVAFIGGAAVCGVAKALVNRPRPDSTLMLGPPETGMSFPSGHTCMGALLFVGSALVLTAASGRQTRIIAMAVGAGWAALIAWSRLLLGYHWLSDTVGSALLATGVLLVLAWRVEAARAYPAAIDPEPLGAPAGAAGSSR